MVPHWDEIRRALIDAATHMAYFKFLSWDMVVMDEGMSIIEADTVSGIQLLQIHRPLLADERIKRFLVHHGIVKR